MNTLKKIGLGVLTLTSIAPIVKAEKQQKPNIVFIMSDDHAVNAISAYKSRLSKIAPTPNIDRIGKEGVIMKSMFATNSISTPSRACILTGKYGHITGVKTLEDNYDASKHESVASMLQRDGYQTGMFGKWHLHTQPTGFDDYCVLPGQGKYHNPKFKKKGDTWFDGKGKVKDRKNALSIKGYVTDIVTDLSLEWLDKRDTDKPFFLMCHHKAPHGLWEPAKRHDHLFKDVTIPEPKSLFERKDHGPKGANQHGTSISIRNPRRNMTDQVTSTKWPTGIIDTTGMTQNEKTSAAYQKYIKDYLRVVRAIDENVGRVLTYLENNNLLENTMVIYTSDQGQFLGEHDYFDKRWMYEESINMPCLIRYPKGIKPNREVTELCTNVDFAPTFLDYAGIKTPKAMQGTSFRKALEGKRDKKQRKDFYYRYWMHMAHHDNPAHYGVRTEQYKLIFFYGLPLDANKAVKNNDTEPYWELYNIKDDKKEMFNLYGNPKYAKIQAKLKKRLLELKKECGDTDEKYPKLMKVRERYWN